MSKSNKGYTKGKAYTPNEHRSMALNPEHPAGQAAATNTALQLAADQGSSPAPAQPEKKKD